MLGQPRGGECIRLVRRGILDLLVQRGSAQACEDGTLAVDLLFERTFPELLGIPIRLECGFPGLEFSREFLQAEALRSEVYVVCCHGGTCHENQFRYQGAVGTAPKVAEEILVVPVQGDEALLVACCGKEVCSGRNEVGDIPYRDDLCGLSCEVGKGAYSGKDVILIEQR